jgi:ketosteroid isomerase-like protein
MGPAETYRSIVDAAAGGDLDGVRQLVSTHSVWHGIGGGGVEELLARLESFHALHTDVRVEIRALVVNGDQVGAHLRWRTVKQGQPVDFDEIELVRVEGGLVVEEWAVDGP